MDPAENEDDDESGRIKAAEDGPLPEEDAQPPCQSQIKKVSSRDSVLTFRHKQPSLKLFF